LVVFPGFFEASGVSSWEVDTLESIEITHGQSHTKVQGSVDGKLAQKRFVVTTGISPLYLLRFDFPSGRL
jgi:hypothetical protein